MAETLQLTKLEKTNIFNELVDVLRQNQSEVAKKLLVEHKWLFDFVDDSGRRAIHWAAVGGCLPFIELMASQDSSLLQSTDDSGWNLLMIAASAGRDNVVRFLLNSVLVDVNHQNKNGQSALHYACSKNHPAIVKLLLENGAEVNIQDKYGAAPIHRASAQGHIDIVRILSENPRFRVQIKDQEGNSPLHLACEDQNDSLAIFLAKLGADVKLENKEKKTPIDYCKSADLRKKLEQFA